jgi:hypothetical protein
MKTSFVPVDDGMELNYTYIGNARHRLAVSVAYPLSQPSLDIAAIWTFSKEETSKVRVSLSLRLFENVPTLGSEGLI